MRPLYVAVSANGSYREVSRPDNLDGFATRDRLPEPETVDLGIPAMNVTVIERYWRFVGEVAAPHGKSILGQLRAVFFADGRQYLADMPDTLGGRILYAGRALIYAEVTP